MAQKLVRCLCILCIDNGAAGQLVKPSTKQSHERRYGLGSLRVMEETVAVSFQETDAYKAFSKEIATSSELTQPSQQLSLPPSLGSNPHLPVHESTSQLPAELQASFAPAWSTAVTGDLQDNPFGLSATFDDAMDVVSDAEQDFDDDDLYVNDHGQAIDAARQVSSPPVVESSCPSTPVRSSVLNEGTASRSADRDENLEVRDEPNDRAQENAPELPAVPADGATARANEPETISFRFDVPQAPVHPRTSLARCDSHWFWQIVILLATWMNLQFHLPHRPINTLLKVLKSVFTQLGHFSADDSPIVNLKTAFRRLGLDDKFEVMPMCSTCRRVFKTDTFRGLNCSHCTTPLYKPAVESITNRKEAERKPILQFPFQSLSSQLPEFVNRDGMEEALDEWRSRERKPGVLADIMDGAVWKNLAGHDGKKFFDNDPDRDSGDELRIGVTFGLDG